MIITHSFNWFVISIFLFFTSCQNGNKLSTGQNNTKNAAEAKPDVIELIRPFSGSKFISGDKILLHVRRTCDTIRVDSIKIIAGSKYLSTLKGIDSMITLNTHDFKVGPLDIHTEAFTNRGRFVSSTALVTILSDIKPAEFSYKVIKTYPHSRNAYVQGLIYDNGSFYESNGEYGNSSLQKIDLLTGEVQKSISVDRSVFAEGIALYKNQIYQLSWREQTCFIYDKVTFALLRKIKYEISQGWGLEFDGNNFLMTDGSNNIYFMDPDNFSQVDQIEVFDNLGPVDSLNELEMINGQLYANVYYKNFVVIIDLKTGKVVGKIDFSGLLPKSEYDESTNVLNGIAWNPANGHLFITGKNWPELFEVELIRKK
jgi:glutaminyl-peptide cyclotransferase